MNEFLRRVLGMTTAGLCVVLLAVTAAVAVADSGKGSEGTRTTTGNSGSGNSEDRENPGKDEENSNKENSDDRGNSEDHRRDGTGTLAHPGKPKQGKTLNVDPGKGKGKVKIKLPGASDDVSLDKGASVPVGSVIDATHGHVTLTTVPREDGMVQSATFSGAAFKVGQSKTGKPVTTIRLRGGSFASCKRPLARRSIAGRLFGAFASASKKRKVRSLWGSGHGNFRTRGRGGAATVRGTIWLTQDTCDGTLVRVRRGVVGVRDFAKKKTFTVRAGHTHFARF
jgi:hypothetical protein